MRDNAAKIQISLRNCTNNKYEPVADKTYNKTCVTNNDSD